MTKLLSTLTLIVLGLLALGLAGPRLVAVLGALLSLVITAGVVGIVLRVVWTYTRRW